MHLIVNGLLWGDETKGSVTDFLSTHYGIETVVRYNGSCQAAHNVHIGSLHHTFSQFGSATFNNAKTILSKYILVDPFRLLNEADVLTSKGVNNALNRLIISENCVIVTPIHGLICQLKELSRSQRNGSVGVGVGEAVADSQRGQVLRVKDLFDPKQASFVFKGLWASKIDLAEQLVETNPNNQKMASLLEYFLKSNPVEAILSVYNEFISKLSKQIVSDQAILDLIEQNSTIFEGAQGTLLDQTHGFFPFVTRSDSTIVNAKSLLNDSFHAIGLVRAYGTRHGSGPFPTETNLGIEDLDNRLHPWQGEFRFGWLDLVLLRYAIRINQGIDSIGLTCVDQLANHNDIKICTQYYYEGDDLESAHRCFDFDPDNPRKLLDLKVPFSQSDILAVLANITPVYRDFSPWQQLFNLNNPGDLPRELKKYINFIEEQLSVPISLISYGADRQQKLFLKKIVEYKTPS